MDPTKGRSLRIAYTPEDDKVNGQPNGATPAWLTFTFDSGSPAEMHHTFNVRHEDTWNWIVSLNSLLARRVHHHRHRPWKQLPHVRAGMGRQRSRHRQDLLRRRSRTRPIPQPWRHIPAHRHRCPGARVHCGRDARAEGESHGRRWRGEQVIHRCSLRLTVGQSQKQLKWNICG